MRKMQMSKLRVAYFEDIDALVDPYGVLQAADRKSAGVTQVEYRSRYQEDARNYVDNWTFGPNTVDHTAYYRIPEDDENMVKNTVVHDLDNSLGQGSDVYLAYLDDFLVANAHPSAPPVALTQENVYVVPAASGDFAQFDVMAPGMSKPSMTVSTKDFNGTDRNMKIYPTNPDSQGRQHFPFNGIIGLQKVSSTGEQGVYVCVFPGAVPTSYEIELQNARAVDKHVIVGVPLASFPSTVSLNNDTGIMINGNNQGITDLSGLANSSSDHVWFFDQFSVPSILYIKTKTILEDAAHSVDWEGTRNLINVID
ncbi:MAG: hypothetical protein DWQ01_14885 [Planctomycetota bacterium]|nr:MAG: hypothetical protein DWQ01_14885 [Planctomycetota bacterium]